MRDSYEDSAAEARDAGLRRLKPADLADCTARSAGHRGLRDRVRANRVGAGRERPDGAVGRCLPRPRPVARCRAPGTASRRASRARGPPRRRPRGQAPGRPTTQPRPSAPPSHVRPGAQPDRYPHPGAARHRAGARAEDLVPRADRHEHVPRRGLMPAATLGRYTSNALGTFVTLLVGRPGDLDTARDLLTAELAAIDAACSRFRRGFRAEPGMRRGRAPGPGRPAVRRGAVRGPGGGRAHRRGRRPHLRSGAHRPGL